MLNKSSFLLKVRTILFCVITLSATNANLSQWAFASPDVSENTNDVPHSQFLATGAGYINNTMGMPLLIMAAFPVVKNGFIPQAQDRLLLEASLGSLLSPTKPSALASIQARWDFFRSSHAALFALGGGGAQATESDTASSEFKFFPRYALGAYFQFHKSFWMRAEASPQWSILAITHGI